MGSQIRKLGLYPNNYEKKLVDISTNTYVMQLVEIETTILEIVNNS